jgi:hypothetical protein
MVEVQFRRTNIRQQSHKMLWRLAALILRDFGEAIWMHSSLEWASNIVGF